MELDLSTREILKLFLMPPASLLILLLIGLLFYRRSIGKFSAWLSLGLLYLSSIHATTNWLAAPLETFPAPDASELKAQGAEAILVLTAGLTRFNPELKGGARVDAMTAYRLSHAVHLHRQTQLPIIISGGQTKEDERTLASLSAQWLRENAQIEPLALENKSLSTWQNAQFTAPLLEELGIKKIALVTHAFHMPRAMQSMREHNIEAIAAPFDFIKKYSANGDESKTWKDWIPSSTAIFPNYVLLHEHIGAIWYRLKQ